MLPAPSRVSPAALQKPGCKLPHCKAQRAQPGGCLPQPCQRGRCPLARGDGRGAGSGQGPRPPAAPTAPITTSPPGHPSSVPCAVPMSPSTPSPPEPGCPVGCLSQLQMSPATDKTPSAGQVSCPRPHQPCPCPCQTSGTRSFSFQPPPPTRQRVANWRQRQLLLSQSSFPSWLTNTPYKSIIHRRVAAARGELQNTRRQMVSPRKTLQSERKCTTNIPGHDRAKMGSGGFKEPFKRRAEIL